jgi:PDZ domain-containing secreted protein
MSHFRTGGVWAHSCVRAGFGALPYTAFTSDPPRRVNGPDLVVRGARRQSSVVPIYGTSLWMEDRLNLWQWLYFKASRRWQVQSDEELHRGATPSQYENWGRRQMRASIDNAIYVSLRHLGYDVPVTGRGALVAGVGPGPANHMLNPGDVIVAACGRTISHSFDLIDVLSEAGPGSRISLEVRTANPSGALERLVKLRLSSDGGPLLGAVLRTLDLRYDFPVDIEFPEVDGLGASAGLAMSISIIDVLTSGNLANVPTAATGSLGADGTTASVLGIAEKARSLGGQEIERMLVPHGARDIAFAHVPRGVQVMEVSCLPEALDALGGAS